MTTQPPRAQVWVQTMAARAPVAIGIAAGAVTVSRADGEARSARCRFRDNRASGAGGRGWCGKPHGHVWPGRAACVPHLRVAPSGLSSAPGPELGRGTAA